MLRAIWFYLSHEVRPRWKSIVSSSQLFIAIALAVAFGVWGDGMSIAEASVSDVMTVALTYSAVAFGFCLAGLTVALTIPNEQFASALATRKMDRPSGVIRQWAFRPDANAYSDLLFVFSWTAAAHWLAIVWGFGLLVAEGFDTRLLAPCSDAAAHVATAGFMGLLAYAAMQFLVTLITLSQVGSAYVASLRG